MVGGKVAPSLTAAAAPSTSTWDFSVELGVYFSTNTITATPTGGSSPFTYLWEPVSGDLVGAVATDSATVMLSASGVAGVIRCLVTDANGVTAYTNNVSIS